MQYKFMTRLLIKDLTNAHNAVPL